MDPEQFSHQLSLDVLQAGTASSMRCPALRTCLLLQPKVGRAQRQRLLGQSRARATGLAEVCIALCRQELTGREMPLLQSHSLLTVTAGDTSLCKLWSSFSPDLYYGVDNLRALEYSNMIILPVVSTQPIWKMGSKAR